MARGKNKYGFVILHYVAYEMTVECVNNLIDRFSNKSIHIVIVDNASDNGSGKKLSDLYKDRDFITVILNQKNEGFARGNNIGYNYLVKNYDVEYIIVMNNDVLVEQMDFLELIDKIYHEEGFAVLGPDIYCPAKNCHQNPAHKEQLSEKTLNRMHAQMSRFLEHPRYYYYRHMIFGPLKKKIIREPEPEKIDWTRLWINPVLHGACYIFSKDFIVKRGYCFFPETFLYMEEDILHYECKRDGLKMLYWPELKANHLEDVSTKASIKHEFGRTKMKSREMKNSLEIFMNLISNDAQRKHVDEQNLKDQNQS